MTYIITLFLLTQSFTDRLTTNPAVSVNVSGTTVPSFFLKPILTHSSSFYGEGAGGAWSFGKKQTPFEISLNYWHIRASDGNFHAKNYSWAETQYMEFENMYFIYAQFSWKKYWVLSSELDFFLRGGIGVGVLTGTVTSWGTSGCTPGNIHRASTNDRWTDSCYHNPNWGRENVDLPPVLPTLEGAIGLRYRMSKDFAVLVEASIFLPGTLKTAVSIEHRF